MNSLATPADALPIVRDFMGAMMLLQDENSNSCYDTIPFCCVCGGAPTEKYCGRQVISSQDTSSTQESIHAHLLPSPFWQLIEYCRTPINPGQRPPDKKCPQLRHSPSTTTTLDDQRQIKPKWDLIFCLSNRRHRYLGNRPQHPGYILQPTKSSPLTTHHVYQSNVQPASAAINRIHRRG